MFSMKCDEGVQPSSFKEGQKIYMDPMHFLPLDRFLPKPKGEKQKFAPGAGSRGGFRGGRGGGRGNFRGGDRGRGNFRGGNFRGGNFRGGNRGSH